MRSLPNVLFSLDDPHVAELQRIAMTLELQRAGRAFGLLFAAAAGRSRDLLVHDDIDTILLHHDPRVLDLLAVVQGGHLVAVIEVRA